MKIKCIDLAARTNDAATATISSDDDPLENTRSSTLITARDNNHAIIRHYAWIMDDVLTPHFLELVHLLRTSLPLDAKRPTVKRRFFSSAQQTQCPSLAETLQSVLQVAIHNNFYNIDNPKKDKEEDDNPDPTPPSQVVPHSSSIHVHVLSYMRFLEYDQVGGNLDPHTDGNKVCEDTNLPSTHTMLLYLTDCPRGGETVLLQKRPSKSSPVVVVVEAVAPRTGRILLFPHATLHEGAPTVDVPKLCLRAEVALYQQQHP